MWMKNIIVGFMNIYENSRNTPTSMVPLFKFNFL